MAESPSVHPTREYPASDKLRPAPTRQHTTNEAEIQKHPASATPSTVTTKPLPRGSMATPNKTLRYQEYTYALPHRNQRVRSEAIAGLTSTAGAYVYRLYPKSLGKIAVRGRVCFCSGGKDDNMSPLSQGWRLGACDLTGTGANSGVKNLICRVAPVTIIRLKTNTAGPENRRVADRRRNFPVSSCCLPYIAQ